MIPPTELEWATRGMLAMYPAADVARWRAAAEAYAADDPARDRFAWVLLMLDKRDAEKGAA